VAALRSIVIYPTEVPALLGSLVLKLDVEMQHCIFAPFFTSYLQQHFAQRIQSSNRTTITG
jgi:hypothetical protein